MRKSFIVCIFLTTTLLVFLPFVNEIGAIEIPNPLKYNTFTYLINAIIDFLVVVALALSSLMIVIAGYYFVTAQGNPQKVQTGKDIILYTLIGLGIILFAKAVTSILKFVIGVK